MKDCYRCKVTKKLESFNKDKSRKDGLHRFCRECQSEHAREYYRTNNGRERHVRLNNKNIERNQKWLLDYLEDKECVHCGESDPIVLEFDHLRDKEFGVSHLATQAYALKRLIQEVEKCQILCSNCHKRKTAKDSNNYKYRYLQEKHRSKSK